MQCSVAADRIIREILEPDAHQPMDFWFCYCVFYELGTSFGRDAASKSCFKLIVDILHESIPKWPVDCKDVFERRKKKILDAVSYLCRETTLTNDITEAFEHAWEHHPDGPVVAVTKQRFDASIQTN